MTEFKDIFIAKGERMTDMHGKTICYAARDIMWIDDPFGVEAFERWTTPHKDSAAFCYDTGLGAPAFWINGESRFFDRSTAEENEARAMLGKKPLPDIKVNFS